MKILFKNNTQYTEENYNAFIQFHKNKYGTKKTIKIGLILLLLIYIFIVNLIYRNWKVILILSTLIILICLLEKFRIKNQITKNTKMIKNNKEFTFYFYEKYIKIKSGREFERLKYFELYKVFETKEYFFLYTDEDHSLIINKCGFEIGTSEQFSEFIKRKCPLKYKKEKIKE